MGKVSKRMVRVNALVKREIAEELEKPEFLRGDGLVSITEVDTSADLRHAKVHVSFYGVDAARRAKIMRELNKIRGELQAKLARHVILKYTPVLQFVLDTHHDEAHKVLAIIEELERDGE